MTNHAPDKASRYTQGYYNAKHPEKYQGDPTRIVYRSSWELKVMQRLDADANVAQWNSEGVIIPYTDRGSGKLRRYHTDFWVKRGDGKVLLIEIKPEAQTKQPIKRPRQTQKSFISEVKTYATNISKWEAAKKFCERQGWTFLILSERDLGILPRAK